MHEGECLPDVVADDEAGRGLFDGPWQCHPHFCHVASAWPSLAALKPQRDAAPVNLARVSTEKFTRRYLQS